jgi:hypothetical protein
MEREEEKREYLDKGTYIYYEPHKKTCKKCYLT